MTTFERRINFEAAYDRRKDKGGIHGVTMRATLIGPAGAVTFTLYTGWQLPHVREEHRELLPLRGANAPLPAGISWHGPTPEREGQDGYEKCEYLGGRTCYGDVGFLASDETFDALCASGEEGMWADLQRKYMDRFAGKEPIDAR